MAAQARPSKIAMLVATAMPSQKCALLPIRRAHCAPRRPIAVTITETELRLMAKAANKGDNCQPVNGSPQGQVKADSSPVPPAKPWRGPLQAIVDQLEGDQAPIG